MNHKGSADYGLPPLPPTSSIRRTAIGERRSSVATHSDIPDDLRCRSAVSSRRSAIGGKAEVDAYYAYITCILPFLQTYLPYIRIQSLRTFRRARQWAMGTGHWSRFFNTGSEKIFTQAWNSPRACGTRHAGPIHRPHGPVLMAQGPGPMAHGPGPMAQGPRPMAQGPRPMAQGPWPMAQGPWLRAHGAWPMAHGPGPMAQGPGPMAQGSELEKG